MDGVDIPRRNALPGRMVSVSWGRGKGMREDVGGHELWEREDGNREVVLESLIRDTCRVL